jgi:hypothetical protein
LEFSVHWVGLDSVSVREAAFKVQRLSAPPGPRDKRG